ncbi:GNAT family N-acetyltransferase [Nocardioides astragali]|uniref:GNAT family N-acetyltransferase n=1 Tax=Nocardioides astragali TaxID=1776736 RepID=A0ABW2MYV0_9ACTN|nr:GNAT family N-acetyltransferase [Nocardioides astragali]
MALNQSVCDGTHEGQTTSSRSTFPAATDRCVFHVGARQLRDLFTDPAMRRQGIARRLVETIQQAASDAGALRLSLQTEPDNVAALALYRQCGFTINADLATLSLNIAR